MPPGAWVAGLALACAAPAHAVDIGVAATGLVVVERPAGIGPSRFEYLARDPHVTTGAGRDPEQISVRFEVRYAGGAPAGAFVIPAGTKSGWRASGDTLAKYVNPLAPGGPGAARLLGIVPGSRIKLVADSLGDFPLDVTAAGAPHGSVFTAACVVNGTEENCHCSEFPTCAWEQAPDGSGATLSCRAGRPDPTCAARRGRCLGSADCVLDDWNGDGTRFVVCGGDSNTFTMSGPPLWCRRLRAHLDGVETRSLGWPGTRASDDPGRIVGSPLSSHFYLERMAMTWEPRPDVVVLAWGTNDVLVHTPEEIAASIDSLVLWMRRAGIVPLVASVPRRFDGVPAYDALIASLNAKLAARYGPCLIDFTTITPPTAEWYVDTRHLNAAAQERRAIAAYHALESLPRWCAFGTLPMD